MCESTEQRAKKAYERFKLRWMLDHDFTLTDLMECMEIMIHEDSTSGLHTKLTELYAAWEFGVGFASGAIWPCWEEYLQNDALCECEAGYLLITVCERDISTERFETFSAARAQMLSELKDEFCKGNSEEAWAEYEYVPEYESCEFSFTQKTAWSNLDDDSNCDWLIIPLAQKAN